MINYNRYSVNEISDTLYYIYHILLLKDIYIMYKTLCKLPTKSQYQNNSRKDKIGK